MAVRGQFGQQYCRCQRFSDALLLQRTWRSSWPLVAFIVQVRGVAVLEQKRKSNTFFIFSL